MFHKHSLTVACFSLMTLVASTARAQKTTTAGEFSVEPPTLLSLGFDWKIAGDDNRNASVEVTYRKKGETAWKKGLPLLRLQHEWVNGGPPQANDNPLLPRTPFDYVVPNMFSGSILNLEPDTEYECRFVMTDPDGISGVTTRSAIVRTRKEPTPAAGGKTYHVYPVDWKGPKQEPAFTGLMSAYYMGTSHYDYENAWPARVKPGDIILVHAGLYVSDRFHYMNGPARPGYLSLGTVFDGTYYLTASGTADKPIVIKGAGDGEAIFDGDGAQNLFNLMAANYNYFEGLTIRNTNVAFLLGIKDIAGSSGFTLKHSKIYNVGRAVQEDWSGAKNYYIADNTFIGRHDPDKMMSWIGAIWEKFPGFPELLASEYAIKVYGQGHVVAHNYLADWHDAVDVATYGNPDGAPNVIEDRLPVSIDFYGNDIFNMGDNCIESDGGAHNVRVFRNRCFNAASQALSAQPMYGGPVYFYQNLVYNSPASGSLKFVATPAGVLVYNNTFVGGINARGPASNVHFRNNLVVSQEEADQVFAVGSYTSYSTSDYNAFRLNPGKAGAFEWNTPAAGAAADYKSTPVVHRYNSLKEYSDASGNEKHSVLVDYDTFVNVTMPDKSDPQRLYKPDGLDFRLKPGSPAIDAGVDLPTITDGFTGKAPDIGAYESGRPVPQYGPRN
ncbi:MAG TPA: choice-of-anchor Q domain-containing protein [Vicinamibacterales bacterium]|nr:choice-of-anchor Q domain-containing protein [Vicinamibacterales bacterium]